MGEYDSAIALAARLISKKGRAATIRRLATTTPDASKPWRVDAAAPTDYPVRAVFLDYEKNEIDGTNVQAGDQKCLVAASGLAIEPAPPDVVVDGAVVWTIVKTKPLRPGDDNVFFDIQLRK